MDNRKILEDVDKLSVAEKILLVGDIWDNILSRQNELPITEIQKLELKERLNSYEKGNEKVKSWREVKKNIKNKI
jgi:putative addiction module component (TIGR02574 family)